MVLALLRTEMNNSGGRYWLHRSFRMRDDEINDLSTWNAIHQQLDDSGFGTELNNEMVA